jgi:hypothetical protein
MSSAALLLGRRSYEGFAAAWPERDGEFADKYNTMPKYVVSSTLRDPEWTNSTVLSGDVVNEITKLTQEQDGDIVVHGSAQLVQSLIENDLVDELRLMVFPVVLGTGKRLSARPPTRIGCSCRHQRWSVTASPSWSTRAPEQVEIWCRAAERRAADQDADHRLGGGGQRAAEGGTANEDTPDRLPG